MTTLTGDDERVLVALAVESSGVGILASNLDVEKSELRDRLDRLSEAGLVSEISDGMFELTQSGRRVLSSTDEFATEGRSTPDPEVNQTIEGFDLRVDRKAAVQFAYRFLRYWGDATAAEITEAIYRERPAGFGSPTSWWEECVSGHLVQLQPVTSPESDLVWRYTGSAHETHMENGRHVAGNYGSIRHAITHLSCTDCETLAVRAAFAHLYFEEPCSEQEFKDARYGDYPAGYDSADEWWNDCVADAFRNLPGVEWERTDGEWHYSPTDGANDSSPVSAADCDDFEHDS